MKANEIVQAVKQDHPTLFKGPMTEKSATRLIKAVFAVMKRQVEGTTEGAMKVQGFGTFKVRKVEREADGKRSEKRIVRFKSSS